MCLQGIHSNKVQFGELSLPKRYSAQPQQIEKSSSESSPRETPSLPPLYMEVWTTDEFSSEGNLTRDKAEGELKKLSTSAGTEQKPLMR